MLTVKTAKLFFEPVQLNPFFALKEEKKDYTFASFLSCLLLKEIDFLVVGVRTLSLKRLN